MHVQIPVTGWLNAVDELPDGATIKSIDNPSLLREVKQRWAAKGRDPRKLITDFRFNDFQEAPAHLDRAGKADHYRQQFRRFIDGTFLRERYGDYIDLIEAENEFTATSTWTDLARTRHLLENIEVQLIVWNTEFRGQWVEADGQRAFIPAHVRLVVCNGPVSNDIHPEILRLAIRHDAAVGYHPYTRWFTWRNAQGVRITRRFEFDWADDCGRFDTMEKRYGIYDVKWVLTECGPYIDVDGGWRDPRVLDGDETLLVEAYGQFFDDVLSCRAYNEGRILGWTGHWFTVGQTKWPRYELEAPQLVKIARKARALWRPPLLPAPPVEDAMNAEQTLVVKAALADVRSAQAELEEAETRLQGLLGWWEAWPEGVINPERALAIPGKVMTFCHANGAPFNPQPLTRPVTWAMWVVERRGNLLKVYDQAGEVNDWWVRAQEVVPA